MNPAAPAVTMAALPDRHGKKWEKNEEDYILRRVSEGAEPGTIGTEVHRTIGGIVCHLREIACRWVNAGTPVEEVSLRTGLPVSDIQDAVKRCRQPKKKETDSSSSEPPAVTMETKETISRDYLRTERARYLENLRIAAMTKHVQRYAAVVLSAAREGKTKYTVDVPIVSQDSEYKVTKDDIIEAYRAKFPDCRIEYGESWEPSPRNPNQLNKKTGIIIDWS